MYWTVFVQGITIKPVVLFFRVKKKAEAELCLTERITNRVMDGAKTAIEDIIGDNSEIPIRFRNWYKVSFRLFYFTQQIDFDKRFSRSMRRF